MRTKFGIKLRLPRLFGAEGVGAELFTADYLQASFYALGIDLCQQLSLTGGVYYAASHSLPTSYAISALQAAIPSYGTAWVLGVSIFAKVRPSNRLTRSRES